MAHSINDRPKVTRRTFLQYGVGTLAAMSMPNLIGCGRYNNTASSKRPNFLILLNDQERAHTHWPEGWTDKHMPTWSRLQKNGLTFTNAYCSASMCSPSRACLLTSQYSNVNGMPRLENMGGLPKQTELPNIASILRQQAGYDVIWKGKWHLSYPIGWQGGKPSSEVWTEDDINALELNYGMAEWNPPEAGNNAFNSEGSRKTLGGGLANNDGRYVEGVTAESSGQTPGFGESIEEYLAKVGATPADDRKPFCLFVSLVNPHDISFYPDGWQEAGYKLEDFADMGIELPPNFADPLTTKPDIQRQFADAYDAESVLKDDTDRLNFVNFYAYLHTEIDKHIQKVLDALEANGLMDDTIIIRTADHGEMGLSHGLREKAYSAYEEIIHVPLVFSNPKLFPSPLKTEALYSHVDMLPTIAALAGIEQVGVGKSMLPVLNDPNSSVQESVLFTFDDQFVLENENGASHIRAIRTARWTYAVYYSVDGSTFQYELYDNDNDHLQMVNLLHSPSEAVLTTWKAMHQQLTMKMQSVNATPEGFTWPASPI